MSDQHVELSKKMEFWNLITDGFMPHGYCLRWDGPLLFVFIVANVGIAIAYFLIPSTLRFFVGRRKDLPYPHMFRLFAAFILSCGITHIAKVWTLYQPAYWIEAAIDLLTAVISLVTAFLLIPLIPQALRLRSPLELDAANQELDQLNKQLQAAKDALESKVEERTRELAAAVNTAHESEMFYRQLFDLMPTLGWTARADGFIDFYNKRWYEYTGTTYEQMQGWGWESVHDPDRLPEVKGKWMAAIKSEQPVELNFPLKGADGNLRWFLTRIVPIHDSKGNVVRWVGINTNIQEQVEQSEVLEKLVQARTAELLSAKEMAEHALATKSRFLATVSHEVRTPMAGIIGLAELLMLNDLGADNNETTKAIFDSSKRLLQILNDVLDSSKLGEGKLRIENRNFPIRPVIGDVSQLLKTDADKKRLRVTTLCDERIPEFVCGDELRLRQVLLNLGFNAIKFTQNGGIHITAQLMDQSDESSVVRFSVADTGIGIPQEKLTKIFQPFEQAENSTTRVFGGTGLGLSISQNLVELMGGTLGVESHLGKGSTFWFELPFHRAERRSDEP